MFTTRHRLLWSLCCAGLGLASAVSQAGTISTVYSFPSTGLKNPSSVRFLGSTMYGNVEFGFYTMTSYGGSAQRYSLPKYEDRVQTGSGATLYGVDTSVGDSDQGAIFKVGLDGTGLSTVYTFAYSGASYDPRQVFYQDGKLYGRSRTGNTSLSSNYGTGTYFKMDANGSNFSVMLPTPSRIVSIVDSNLGETSTSGVFYGEEAIASTGGRLYRFNSDGTGYTVLHNFNSGDGSEAARPTTPPIELGGRLYGIAVASVVPAGHSKIYSMNPDGTDFTLLYSFPSLSNSFSNLVSVGSKLYARSNSGGDFGNGYIFSIDTSSSDFTMEYSFPAGLTVGSELSVFNSRVYGTTFNGGAFGAGQVYVLGGPVPVPEPASLVLGAMGVVGAVIICRGARRRKVAG